MTVEKHSGTICGCSAEASAINTHEATAERMCFNYSLTQCAVDLLRRKVPLRPCYRLQGKIAVNRHKLLNPQNTRHFSLHSTFYSIVFYFYKCTLYLE